MNRAVVKLDPLPDPYRTRTQNNDLFIIGRFGFGNLVVGGIVVGGLGLKLCCTGVHHLIGGLYAGLESSFSYVFSFCLHIFCDDVINKTHLLGF